MLKYSSYTFSCTLKNDAILPPYKGSTFRGALGGALKKIVCTFKNKKCCDCLLADRCVYSQIFELVHSANNPHSARTIPHPYIIEPDVSVRTRFTAAEVFTFTIVLFGEFVTTLPYLIYAVDSMGETGIGKTPSGRRAQFSLKSVTTPDGQVIYKSSDKRLIADKNIAVLQSPDISDNCHGTLNIQLVTPLRLKNENRFTDSITFKDFIRTALRRVSSMHAAYGHGDPPLDYRTIVNDAEKVKTSGTHLSWRDWTRYSNRQHDAMLFGGMMGNISFVGNIGPFMQIIEQARIVHIGKQTTFGLGYFTYTWKPDVAAQQSANTSRKRKNSASADDKETIQNRYDEARRGNGIFSIPEIMLEFNISRATIYRIIQTQTALMKRETTS